MKVGIVATSSPVGPVELRQGIARLEAAGFEVVVHPNVLARSFVTGGTDAQRAGSFLDYAFDDSVDVIWSARGGYGAARVAGELAEATRSRRVPRPKLLVGYSDVTFLHEFVRNAWGWRTLHAQMITASPGANDEMWAASFAIVRGERPTLPYETPCLRWMANPPTRDITAEVIGGNMSLWTSLAGTPWQPSARGRILFLEDISEKIYRLDRYVVQLEQAGMLAGAAAIVLGDFTHCDDEAPTVLADDGVGRVPMRPTVSLSDGLNEIFGRVARKHGIPLAAGLPVGHGPGFWPLRLGVEHRLSVDGALVAR
jgi:muramoyltetrapeptide carboxypeptidase